MAQNNPVETPKGEWVDLYTETGIAVGTQIVIQNTGDMSVILVDSASEPSPGTGFNVLNPYEYLVSGATPDGVWAKSSGGSQLQVEEYTA